MSITRGSKRAVDRQSDARQFVFMDNLSLIIVVRPVRRVGPG